MVPAERPTILVLHGITMNGPAMLRVLGPLGEALEAAGFDLVAPNAPHVSSDDELARVLRFIDGCYTRVGASSAEWFRQGVFWEGPDHRDWLVARTDPDSGRTTCAALSRSLETLAEVVAGRQVVGVLGFSQGAAMAAVVTALANRGRGPLPEGLRFACLLSGFLVQPDEPALELWPAPAGAAVSIVIGDRDPIFAGGAASQAGLADAFAACEPQLRVVPDLGHDVPRDADSIERIVALASRVA